MAQKIANPPARVHVRTEKYPWDEWFDGDWWELFHGDDYEVATDNMRAGAHTAAKRRGGKVSTRLTENGFALRFFIPAPAENGEQEGEGEE